MRIDPAISELPASQNDALKRVLAPHDWAALPLETRVTCFLFDALAALDAVWLDLQTEEGNTLRWIEPRLRALSDNLNAILERLAS